MCASAWILQAWRNKIPLVRLIGTCTRVRTLVCMQKLEGLEVCSPRKFFEFWMLWDGFWGYFMAQNITTHFYFSPGTHGDRSVHRQFQTPWKQLEGATHASRYQFCLVSSAAWECVANTLKSARSQVFTGLFYVWTVTFMWAWTCTDDTWASRL